MGTLVRLEGDAGRWYSHLATRLERMRVTKSLCDVSLVSQDGHVVPVHSPVLAAVSPVLESLLKAKVQSNDDNDNCVFLDDVTSGNVLTSLVDFVYTGSCDIAVKNLDEVCSAARTLKLNQLQELCVKKFKDAGINYSSSDDDNNNNDEKKVSKNKDKDNRETK